MIRVRISDTVWSLFHLQTRHFTAQNQPNQISQYQQCSTLIVGTTYFSSIDEYRRFNIITNSTLQVPSWNVPENTNLVNLSISIGSTKEVSIFPQESISTVTYIIVYWSILVQLFYNFLCNSSQDTVVSCTDIIMGLPDSTDLILNTGLRSLLFFLTFYYFFSS